MQKYEKIAQDLLNRIHETEFHTTGKLPTERELMEQYTASRNTVRQALKVLLNSGAVYSKQGSGVWIRSMPTGGSLSITVKPGQMAKNLKTEDSKNVVLSIEIVEADESLAKDMLCEVGTPVYDVKRLRIMNGHKFAYEHSYYNKDYVLYLNKEICESSIYSHLIHNLKLKIGFADKYIYAEKLSEEIAEYLELQPGDPGLVICDRVHLDNGKLFNISKMTYNYKYTKLYAGIA